MDPRSRRGFTLIELLVVIAIVLILVAIGLPHFLEAVTRAKVTRARAEMRTLVTALETYFTAWGNYPRGHDPTFTSRASTRRDNGLTRLTSPIKYLAGPIPEDAFGVTDWMEQSGFWHCNERMHYRGYSGSDSIVHLPCGPGSTPFCGCGDPHPETPRGILYPLKNRGCVHAYVVISTGPDHAWSYYHANRYWPYYPTPSGNFTSLPTLESYSPTNGTKSSGDIFQMTGDWRNGYFLLDGQIVGHP